MRILEVRDGFIKFEADAYIQLSSFVRIDGIEKKYVAQVFQLKKSGEYPIAYAKILFLYTDDEGLKNYDKTLPSKDSEILNFDNKILLDSIKYENPIIVGKTIGTELNIVVDESIFNKKTFISTDFEDVNNIIIRNLSKQFLNINKKIIIIDTLGLIRAKKYSAGVDFKLPLDTNSLNFLYNDCLNDVTADSKSLIMEIFKDLAEYSKTVPFLPFSTLKNIVDEMVDKEHVFKLLVLKNKLAKFDKLGYFAKNQVEIENFNKILDNNCVVLDLSKLEANFQNQYIEFLYKKFEQLDDIQVFLELSNTVNKKNLRNILSNINVSTTFVSHSKFKYLNDIKNLFDNFIITPSFANNQIFEIYSSFLKSMTKEMSLVIGEGTNYIPLVTKLQKIDEVINVNKIEKVEKIEDSCVTVEDADNEEDCKKTQELDEFNQEDGKQGEISDLEDKEDEILSYVDDQVVEKVSEEVLLSTIDEKSKDVISKIAAENSNISDVNLFDGNSEIDGLEQNFNIDDVEKNEGITIPENDNVEDNVEEGSLEEKDNNIVDLGDIQDSQNEEVSDSEDEIISEDSECINSVDEADDNSIASISDIEDENVVYDNLLENQDIDIGSNNEELEEYVGNVVEIDDELDVAPITDDIEEISSDNDLEMNSEDELSVMPLDNVDEYGEITELNPEDIDENDILVDLSDETNQITEDLDEQIVKDVDKVFTTRRDDEISDTDLDFIDELNSDDILEEVSADDGLLENFSQDEIKDDEGIIDNSISEEEPQNQSEENEILETKNSTTPIVPIYSAEIPHEDLVESDPIQQGDSVTHSKYGVGVVEKMIKYGNKTLYSINFDNIGRRLLDPTLTEIKKI